MKVFLTGASGFVGRNMIVHLLQSGDSVTALSRSERADKLIQDAATSAGGSVTIFRGDVTNEPETLAKGTNESAL